MNRSGLFWYVLPLIVFCCLQPLSAQQVVWADTVITYSSEYSPNAYSASQVLGPPSVLPAIEPNTTAWAPRWPDKGLDSIKVGYAKPVHAWQIIICQSYHPGAVAQVTLISEGGQRRAVSPNATMDYANPQGGVLALRVDPAFLTQTVVLTLDTRKIIGYNHIDAIGLSPVETPFRPRLVTAPEFEASNPQPLSEHVNSPYNDLHPMPTANGQTLFFTRKGHPGNYGSKDYDDIWISNWKDGEWSEAENPGTPVNTVGQNHLNALAGNGRKIYCAGNIEALKGDDRIYTSFQTSYGWSTPEEVAITDFYNHSGNTSFHLTRDERVMIISLQRDDSRQSKDLYVCFAQEDGTFSAPQNLGKTINTVGDEVTPFVAMDGATLYFASNGHPGLGKMDLYKAQRLDETWTRWTKPQNLGPPINSAAWEAYLSQADSAGDYFFARHIPAKQTDIFHIVPAVDTLPDTSGLTINVVDVETGEPVTALVHVKMGNSEVRKRGATVTTGNMATGKGPITVQVSAKGYFSASRQIVTGSDGPASVTISLYSLKEGVVIPLQNIFFEANNDKLKPSSFPELNNLATFLKSHKEVRIEIAGHTNNLCSSSYCMRLSTNRARAVAQYLKNQGVAARQLQYQGYGKQQPVDSNETEAGRKRNQRVEVRVLQVETSASEEAD